MAATDSAKAATSHTVLIVDDDVDIRETVAEALQDAGYDVKSASNGQEALEVLKVEPQPCLILLDLMMPVMDGEQFRAAQKTEPAWADIPVVVISAGGHCEEAAERMGAASCVKKPFRIKELFQAVQRFC